MDPPQIFEGAAKEKFFYHNTLLCLVKALQGQNTTVDLRNDGYICGCIANVDGYMNVSFTNAVYCNPQGEEFSFENIFIQGRNIRYVHIPSKLSIPTLIKNELHKTKTPKFLKKPAEKSRKVKKAIKQHMETVALLHQ